MPAKDACTRDPLLAYRIRRLYNDIVSADYTVDCGKLRTSYMAGIVMVVLSIILLSVGVVLGMSSRAPVLAGVFLLLLGLVLIFRLNLEVSIAKRTRAKEAEQELPYFALLLTVVASLGQPLHTALRLAMNFDIFRRTKRDLMFVEKISILYRLSRLEAMRVTSRLHPSITVSDFYRTIVLSERAGGDRYTFYYNLTLSMMKVMKDRIERMVEKFSNVINILLIFFVVVPVAAVTLSALFAGDRGLNIIVFTSIFYPILVALLLALVLGNLIPEELRDPVDPRDSMRFGLTVVLLGVAIYLGVTLLSPIDLPLHVRVFAALAIPLFIVSGPLLRKIRFYQKLDAFTPFLARYIEEETKKGNQPIQALSNLIETSRAEEGDRRVLDPDVYKLMGKIVLKARIYMGGRTDGKTNESPGMRGEEPGPIKRAIEGVLLPWPLRMVFEYLDLFTKLGSEPRSATVIADFIDSLYAVKKIIAERAAGFFMIALVSVIVMVVGFTIVNNLVLPQVAGIEIPETQYTGFTISPIERDLLQPIKELTYTNVLLNSILISLLLSKMSRGTIQHGFIYGLILVVISFGFIMMLDLLVSI